MRVTRSIGEALKELREERGMHRTEFAQLIGVHHANYCEWERDEVNPRSGKLQAVCHRLGIKTSEFYQRMND